MFEYKGKTYTLDSLAKLAKKNGYSTEDFISAFMAKGMKQISDEPVELTDSEQFENIFSNASLTLQNAWNSTQLASVDFANYLGIVEDDYADNFIEKEYGEIEAINKKYEDTGKGIYGGFKEGDYADVALGVVNALTSVVTTVAPAIATRGVSLIPQIMAPMYTEYNAEKARVLYGDENIEESIRKLRENEEDEVVVPFVLGTAAVALEKIGIKGISKYITNQAKNKKAKNIVALTLTANKEGLTEYFQGGLNAANVASARGEDPLKATYDHLTSDEAKEEYLMGFVGGAGMSAGGRAINSAIRSDQDNLVVNSYITRLGVLQQEKVNSKTERNKKQKDKEIKKLEKEFKSFLINNQQRSKFITEEQSKELLGILDTKQKLNNELSDFQKQFKNGKLSQNEFNDIVKGIENDIKAENDKAESIRVEANKKFLMDDLRVSETAINKVLGLEQKTYKTEQEFLDAYNAKTGKNYTLNDIDGVDGLIVGNEIMINVETAAKNNAVTVGSHELLHGILKSSLTGSKRSLGKNTDGSVIETDLTVEGETLIKDFLGTLSKKELSVVQKRIDNNYRYNRDKNGKIISEKQFAEYAEEYLNAYADAAIKNEITDSLLVKIGNFLSKIFNVGNKGYKNLEFKTGKDVKAFLKAYVSDRKKGKFRQQFVEMAQEGAKQESTVEKKSRSKAVDAVNKMEKGAKTQEEFLAKEKVVGDDGKTKVLPSPFDNVYNSIVEEGGAINNYIKSLPLSKEKRQETIDELGDRLINYNPSTKRKTDSGEPITVGEFLMSNIGFAKLEADKKLAIEAKKEGKTKRIDAAKKTKEGETTFDIEDTDASAQEILDEQDMSVEGVAKREAKENKAKKKRNSKLRQELGFETDGDAYNKVLDSARKSLLLAYKKTANIKDPKARVDKIVQLLKKEYNSLTSDLFKPLKNFLGVKDYLSNLKTFKEAIVESISTADLVQMERNVPDADKVFVVFERQLTTKKEVQDAIDKNLLPKDDLNRVSKGPVNLYKKVMPTDNEIVGFADQPAINPETGQRSGLKGTRKDGFAKRIAETLILDAIMEVRQETEVQKTLTEDLNVEMDVQQLASKIGRDVNVKFSKSNAVADIDNAIDVGTDTGVYLQVRFSKSHREQYENRLKKNRTDLTEEQRKNAVQSVFDFVDGKDIPNNKKSKYEKMAMHYMVNGHLILPEDGYKVIEAERLAAKNKIDPFSVKDPNALIQTYVEDSKTKRTDPDKVKTFSNKTEWSNGVVVYDVEDSKQGQEDVRKVADTHFGKKFQNWCLIHRSKRTDQQYGNFDNRQEAERFADEWKAKGYEVEISLLEKQGEYEVFADLMGTKEKELDVAFDNWNTYNKGGNGHKVAFHNGKLVAFRDGNQMNWWDINDNPTESVVVKDKKVGDGFREVVQVEKNKSTVLYTEKQTGNKKNGTYTKKNLNGDIVEITTKKNSRKYGKQFELLEKVYYTAEITSNYDGRGSRVSYNQKRTYKKFKGKSKQEKVSFGRDQISLDDITKWEKTIKYTSDGDLRVTTVEGTVKQDMFEEAKNPDAITDPFTKKNLKYLVMSNERYFPLQGKKVTVKQTENPQQYSSELQLESKIVSSRKEANIIIAKARAEGKIANITNVDTYQGNKEYSVAILEKLPGGETLTINGEVQEERVRFSRSANNEVKFSLTQKQDKKVSSYIKTQIDELNKKDRLTVGEKLIFDVLNVAETLIDNGHRLVDVVDILNDRFPTDLVIKISELKVVEQIRDSINKFYMPEIRRRGMVAALSYTKPLFEAAEGVGAKMKIVDEFVKNIGRSNRTGEYLSNEKFREQVLYKEFGKDFIDKNYELQEVGTKENPKKALAYKKTGYIKTGKLVPMYQDITKIKNTARNNNDVSTTVNDEAAEARAYIFKILDSDLTVEQRLSIVDLMSLDQRGPIRKMYEMGITLDGTNTEVTNTLKGKKVTLEHEITVTDMTLYLQDHIKGRLSLTKLNEIINQAKVHVLPVEYKGFKINDILNEAKHKVTGGSTRYKNPKIQAFLNLMQKDNLISSMPESLKSVDMSNLETLLKFSRSTKNPTKGITILDFDDTLATSSSLIRYTRPDGTTGTLTPEQYASTYEDLLGLGYEFDFSEFNKVVDGKPAPLLNKAKKLAGKFGTKNMFILTARPAESAVAIQKFLKENGLDIPIENITGLGNSTAEAKALWVLGKAAEGYNDFYFADDAIQNVKAVQNMLDQIDVKSKVQQARVKFSKSMDKDFNNILEDVSGIESKKRFSEAKARRRGRSKGKFRYFVPPSHEDFIGLLYNFMGKGEKGNQHRNFFEKSLVRPLNKAYRALNAAKQAIANDYRALIKGMPEVRKKLGKKILDGDYTHEDAIRVYLWDKAGFKIPGLSKTDQKKLSDFVKNDPALQSFADALGVISKDKDGYVQPSDNWDLGGIKYDLIDATGRIGRAQFFQEFIENADIIFSEENLNKIEAIYGEDFRSALEDMLYRVTNGTNRPTGKNKIVNRWIDWINGSVGATMFFNARSAILQQLSFVNFMNFADNNIFKAAKAFANQPQFWADFTMIFNSDYLKQRRTGAGFDVNASEIAREVSGSKEPVRAAIRYILNLGFLPTQMGDSFAIAIGGASFYRNRVNTYLKQGLSQKEAESKAFIDFQEIAEETQQSARPDMISQQQASFLGRFVLAFQNVTSQYVRIIKKSSLDLINRRISKGYTSQAQSDMANVSRIMYYGAIQSVIFYGLQSALFAMMFDDDERDEEFFEKKKDRIIHGTIDSILRGAGVFGAILSTIKNTAKKYLENQKSDSWFKSEAWPELLQISPPVGIKVRKIRGAERTTEWNKDVIKEMETFDIDNPLWDAVTGVIEGGFNVPVNRLHRKIQNLRAAQDSENAWWQRIALVLGWSKWDLGIENKKVEEVKKKLKKDKSKKKKTKEEQIQEKENEQKQKKERKEGKETTCIAVTSKGNRCSNKPEGNGKYCTIHAKVEQNKSGEKKQCKKTKSDGKRCKMQTSSKSGYCYYHD